MVDACLADTKFCLDLGYTATRPEFKHHKPEPEAAYIKLSCLSGSWPVIEAEENQARHSSRNSDLVLTTSLSSEVLWMALKDYK